jgi:hypothetical protein
MLSQGGEPGRYFGEADEIWTPYDANGDLAEDGPRFAGDAVPDGLECGCLWSSIDAALEAAGFLGWMTASKLMDVAHEHQPVWRRPGA